MTDRRPTIAHLVRQALELGSPEAREAYLEAACAGDPQLRAAVEQEFVAPTAEAPAIAPQAEALAPSPAPAPKSLGLSKGDRVGRLRLLEILGEGGFGIVWRAEQTKPVRREVARRWNL